MTTILASLLAALFVFRPTDAAAATRIQPWKPEKDLPASATALRAVPNQLLVTFKSAPTITAESEISMPIPFTKTRVTLRQAGFAVRGNVRVTALNKRLKLRAMRVLGASDPGKKVALLELPSGTDTKSAIDQYKSVSGIEVAEPNYLIRNYWIPDDPYAQRTAGQDYQWNLHSIRMPDAWNIPPRGGSPNVKVVVIDAGVAFENYQGFAKAPELANVNFLAPKRFESLASDCQTIRPTQLVDDHPNDQSGHGTHVTATIVQTLNNGAHAAGIAPNVSIIPIKFMTYCTSGPDAGNDLGTLADLLSAITHGVGATAGETAIFNMSFGTDQSPLSLTFAMIGLDAISQDVVAAASGNGATRTSSLPVLFPAAFPYGNVIGVGAVRFDGRRAEYSQYGPVPSYPDQSAIDLVAPGGQMWTDSGLPRDACLAGAITPEQELACLFLDQNHDTAPDGIVQQTILPGNPSQFTEIGALQYGFRCLKINAAAGTVGIDQVCGLYNGTSMAAPHVSAAAALMLSINPNLTHHQIRDILVATASKSAIPDYNQTEHGAGLLDVAAALSYARSLLAPTATPSPARTPTPTGTRTPTPTPEVCASTLKHQGDATCDCSVDGIDYTVWLLHYDQYTPNGYQDGDFNGNGTVDGIDYTIWLTNYQRRCP